MTFWTLLFVSYIGPGDVPAEGAMILPTYEHCVEAMDHFGDTLPNPRSHDITCEATGLLSSSPRPKMRPWKESEE